MELHQQLSYSSRRGLETELSPSTRADLSDDGFLSEASDGRASLLEEKVRVSFSSVQEWVRDKRTCTILFALASLCLFFVALSLQRAVEQFLSPILLERANGILKDVIIIVIAVTVLLYIDYLEVFDSDLDVYGICLVFLFFGAMWFGVGLLVISITQRSYKKWKQHEKLHSAASTFAYYSESNTYLARVLEDYKNLYTKRRLNDDLITLKELAVLESRQGALEYLLMRQDFISATYLPPLAESFLRDDFNFAEYLVRCLAKVLGEIFSFELTTVATVLINLLVWAVIRSWGNYFWNVISATSH